MIPAFSIVVVLCFVQGCGRESGLRPLDAPQTIDANVLVRLPLPRLEFREPIPAAAPKRIVSVIPSATELIFALGLGDRLVGRSDWCDWPPEAETRPALGNQQSLSVERVADLLPDLVVFWAHLPDKQNRLTELFKLNVVSPGTESRAEVLRGIELVAAACRVPGRGRQLLDHIEADLEHVRARYKDARPRRTLVVLDRNQAFFVPGRESFLQEIFDICNVDSVSASLDAGKWPAVPIERILDWNPEVILDLSLGAASGAKEVAEARKFWSAHDTLDAVRNGRVIVLNAGVLVRPGPRLAVVAEELARIVHGA